MNRKKINIQIGRNLRKARKAVHLTQQNVSDRLGVERSVYTRYETGDIEIPLATFARICKIVDAEPSVVLDGVEV